MKSNIGKEPRAFLARNTKEQIERIHDRERFLILDSMARIGEEVAKKGARNEEIMKESLEAKTATHAYALKEWCARTLQHRCVRTISSVHTHPSNLDGMHNGVDAYA
ncbi:hypothetical protein PIB30_083010 [Stylosanthes scabra]|uniref:Uncharacterized protein n=1 Tax=Stylosanthes scabra TaxID=79078 RepID=A0ABU6TRN8_9FABA|nr:hypothetical protein [Stylosanthes scabra]